MKCDPRVVSLTGIQAAGGTVESGNHLRAFVGVEHGFFESDLAVYRRQHVDKLDRLMSFTLPVRKNKQLIAGWREAPSQPIPIEIETDDPSLTLSGRIRIAESGQLATLEISIPALVGYLEIRASRVPCIPGFASMLGELPDNIRGSDILVLSDNTVGSTGRNVRLLNRARTGLRVSRTAKTLSRLSNSRIGRAINRFLWRICNALRPLARMEVVALYDGELVATEQADRQGHISLTNVPLDEIRITAPLEYGFRVDFLLMEEDAVQGDWVKVERLPGPQKLLDLFDPQNPHELFERLLRTRFWPDVHNRFVERGQDTDTAGWPAITTLYGAGNFEELIDLIGESFGQPSQSIQRLNLGPRVARGLRGYQSMYTARNYDPEQLAFLITPTLDVNIATLLGLHTVDRGQDPKLPGRGDDPAVLKKYTVTDWKQKFDYKVQGKWAHLADIHAYVYYDLSRATTPPIFGKAVDESRTLDGVEVGSESGELARFYKVGLRWDITQDHRSAVNIAYDVYRDSQLLTIEPMTPARAEEKPATLDIPGRNIQFHRSLPVIPPFSRPHEITPAPFQYVDAGARFGEAKYAVESVDIHGRYSRDGVTYTHQIETAVPIPVPSALKAEIRPAPGVSFDVVVRWDWPEDHRALALDWVRFEVFFHDGVHRVALNGAVLWVEKHPSEAALGKFRMQAFIDSANSPVPPSSLSGMSDNLLLRSSGRTYPIGEVSSTAGPQQGVGLINNTVTGKARVGANIPPAMPDGSRGVLMKRATDALLRVPFFLLGTAEPEALAGDASAGPVRVLVSNANAAQLSQGDEVRVLLGDFLLAGSIASVDTGGVPSSRDGIAVVDAEVQFDSGWAEYHVPVPTSPCSWLKVDSSDWIDWNDESSWPVGPIALDRPAEYPLQSIGGTQNQFPINIAGAPDPQLNRVADQSGQPSPTLSSVVLPTDGFAAPSDSLLTGCQITVGGFDQLVRQNLSGTQPQLATTIPANFSQSQADALLGQQAQLSQASASYSGSVNTRAVNRASCTN